MSGTTDRCRSSLLSKAGLVFVSLPELDNARFAARFCGSITRQGYAARALRISSRGGFSVEIGALKLRLRSYWRSSAPGACTRDLARIPPLAPDIVCDYSGAAAAILVETAIAGDGVAQVALRTDARRLTAWAAYETACDLGADMIHWQETSAQPGYDMFVAGLDLSRACGAAPAPKDPGLAELRPVMKQTTPPRLPEIDTTIDAVDAQCKELALRAGDSATAALPPASGPTPRSFRARISGYRLAARGAALGFVGAVLQSCGIPPL